MLPSDQIFVGIYVKTSPQTMSLKDGMPFYFCRSDEEAKSALLKLIKLTSKTERVKITKIKSVTDILSIIAHKITD